MSGAELLDLATAAPIAGVSAGQLARAARDGKLPGAVRQGGRWRIAAADAAGYREAKRGPGRPASAGVEVELVRDFPHSSRWRARVGAGEWAVSTTRERAIKAAHTAARSRRLVEAQRRELARWRGAPRRRTRAAEAGSLAPGRRVVVARRGRELRAVVLEVSSSGRVSAGWLAEDGRVHVTRLEAADVREELSR